jgi:hypothetical protein
MIKVVVSFKTANAFQEAAAEQGNIFIAQTKDPAFRVGEGVAFASKYTQNILGTGSVAQVFPKAAMLEVTTFYV